MESTASRKDICLVAKKILSPLTTNIVSVSGVPHRLPNISVCPRNSEPVFHIASLLIGEVTTPSVFPESAASVAASIEAMAARPASSWTLPHSMESA